MAASRPLPLRLAVPLALALLLALALVADFLRASSSSRRISARTVTAPRGPHCPDCLTRTPFSEQISWF
jgi:hypothetical protein